MHGQVKPEKIMWAKKIKQTTFFSHFDRGLLDDLTVLYYTPTKLDLGFRGLNAR